MRSLAEENYLKGLFQLANDAGETGVQELSRHLGIKMPTVNSMVKRLAEKGLVHYESYRPLRLTESGRQEAALIIRKHRLTEMFLVEKMGFGWERVHEIAEQVEHIQAPEFFDRMDALLGFPDTDPHGAPIPDPAGNMPILNRIRLSECQAGDQVRLAMVTHTPTEFLRFLDQKGLAIGSLIRVKSFLHEGAGLIISYTGHPSERFEQKHCEVLLVEKI
ncbi:MAG: metal-dependent transcriptional regulator [Bacteroidetes bacterium]|nr:metal-dependent transcriptional regulator [Bacteroidota bacterium]